MSNNVDKFFKERLEGHALQPSAQAWEKVEAHLAKKNKMVLWFRVAAAVALLSAIGIAVLTWNPDAQQQEIVREKDSQPVKQPAEDKSNLDAKPTETIDQKLAETTPKLKRNQTKKTETAPAPLLNEQPPVVHQSTEELPQVAVNETTSAPTVEKVAEEKPVVIVYSLPTVRKPIAEPQAEVAVAEVKKTGLERVLEIAKDVKNSDSPMADLREAKDDILAFEFRKDKDKNKKQNY